MQEINYKIIELDPPQITVDRPKFHNLCKNGCKVFGTKWSCPPASTQYISSKNACVIVLWMNNIIESKNEYTKVKAINSILKSRLYKLLYQYPNTRTLGSGSCRLCQKCHHPGKCKRPDKMIYSMESVGIDVDSLCKSIGTPLHWYKKGKKYEYGSVVGMIIEGNKTKIESQLNNILNIQDNHTQTKIIRIDNIQEI